MLSKTFYIPFSINSASKTCKLPIPYALIHPHSLRDAGFEPERDNKLEGLPPL